MNAPVCCFEDCQRPATFTVYGHHRGVMAYDDATESCQEHLDDAKGWANAEHPRFGPAIAEADVIRLEDW